MTVLSEANRQAVEDKFVQDLSSRRDPTPLTRTEIRQVLDTIDDEIQTFLDVTMPSALPAPAAQMSEAQLDRLYRFIANRRFEVNHG